VISKEEIKQIAIIKKKEEASLIIRLMMASNDITTANHAASTFKDGELKPTQEHIRQGYRMYFIRIQTGHLNEAMKLIKELSDMLKTSKSLSATYEKCLPENKKNFLKLQECLPLGKTYNEFKQNVTKLRHKIVFHYNEKKLFKNAISNRIKDKKRKYSSITISDDIRFGRFNIADEIIDTVVCSDLWNLHDDSTLRNEADKHAQFGFELCVSFINFCKEFIFLYIKEHGER